jgi:3-oxoacyl-[acyl-carrier-protein] synthase II
MEILVSGYGVISAAGNNCKETYQNFLKETRNAERPTHFSTALEYPVFEVNNLKDAENYPGQRTIALLITAVKEALSSAYLHGNLETYRVGVCLGTTVACQLSDIEFYKKFRTNGEIELSAIDKYLNGNIAEVVKKEFNLAGLALTVVNACSSGTDAIGTASYWINNDLCDIVITGGADEIYHVPCAGFGSLGVASTELCKPFDKNRSGLNLGEGAGIIILESEKHALNRGMASDVYFSSYSAAADAYHLTAPHPEGFGLQKALVSAMKQASISFNDVAFINAHGTSTRDNDRIEGKVFSEVFGKDILFLSTKGYTGHTLGAAGGIEAVFSIMALKSGWLPKSIGFETLDDEIGISPVIKKTDIHGRFAISTSLAFGGNNAVVIFEHKSSNHFKTSNPQTRIKNCELRTIKTPAPNPQPLTPKYINGIGILGKFGRGIDTFSEQLEKFSLNSEVSCEDYCVASESLKDKVLGKKLRRADRYTKMAVLAANDCLNDNKKLNTGKQIDLSRTGVILATAFGPHNTSFSFLDDILEYGEDNVSAIKFSHSVHNAAASYIALLLGITGPTLTVTQIKFPVQHALTLASCWLNSNACDNVLVCSVDEKGELFNEVAKRKLNIAKTGNLNPLSFSEKANAIPSEGSVCFLLQKNIITSESYCEISKTSFEQIKSSDVDLCIIGADGIPQDETCYTELQDMKIPLGVYTSLYGSMIIGSAFDCAVGAVLLKNKFNKSISSIGCHKLDCNNKPATILLNSVQ